MSKLNANESLNSSISLLEQKRERDFLDLKHQLRLTGESLKPANIVRSAVQDIVGSKQAKSFLIKAAIGLAIGFVATKVVKRNHSNKHKNGFLGDALQYGMGMLAAQRNNLIKAAGIYVAKQVISKIRERRQRRRYLNDGEYVLHEDL